MSQSKQALRTRIKSVQSTKKITKAMEMIANAKLLKQRNSMEANRIYAERLYNAVNEIASNNPDLDNKYMRSNNSDAVYAIVFCSDLGLCGGYNSNVMKFVQNHLKQTDRILLVGTSLFNALKEAGYNTENEKPINGTTLTFQDMKKIVERSTELFLNKEVGKVMVVYTKFINTMTFTPSSEVLLPCEKGNTEAPVRKEGGVYVETLFEPDADSIFEALVPMMIQESAYACWMESSVSEQGSRRTAMKTATDNAEELNESLLLEYNKARQAAITQEITEIVGGSSAV